MADPWRKIQTHAHTTESFGRGGRVLAARDGPSAAYEFRGDEMYVRARLTGEKTVERTRETPGLHGRRVFSHPETAWTQPFFLADSL